MKSKIAFYDRKMEIPVQTGIVTHYYGELMYIKFDKPYCLLHFIGKKKYKVEENLQEIMKNLPGGAFMKCKRSSIINICYYDSYRNTPPVVTMIDGEEFRLSKQNILVFREIRKKTSRISPPCTVCYTCTDIRCESQVVFCRKKNKEPK